MSSRVGRIAGPLCVLTLQNLCTFWNHYFRGHGFTWDFVQSYFGMGSFSVAALQQGLLPQWQPFQCMGYPYALNLQSGLYYPPLWLVAALGVDYDLGTATAVQCLHVLFGAAGAFFLLREVVGDYRAALVGAAMYQFFGGFYGNAQHPDIIRAFACIPWVFWCVAPRERSGEVDWRRRLALPAFVYLLATGGYPGNLVATSFAVGVFLLLQLVDSVTRGERPLRATWQMLMSLALYLLGLAMSIVHLGPAWFERDSLLRAGETLRYRELSVEHLPTLFFSSSPLPGEPSMSSAYLTVPGLALVFFLSREVLRRAWTWIALGALGVAMVAGESSFVWRAAVVVLEPLRLSRFPSSDYRPLIAMALVVLAGFGLVSLQRKLLTSTDFTIRSLAVFAAVAWAGARLYGGWLAAPVLLGLLVALATLWLLSAIGRQPSERRTTVVIMLLLVLIGLDGLRVLTDMKTWSEPSIEALYRDRGWVTTSEPVATDESLFVEPPASRPAREETGHPHWFSWAGYLQGRYMVADKAPCLLASSSAILADPVAKEYMIEPWTPLVFPLVQGRRGVVVPEAELTAESIAAVRASRQVQQTLYGVDEIRYRVSLPRPSLVVENETYFRGWQAVLETEAGTRRVEAQEVGGGFRGWALPAGGYTMIARFRPPHTTLYRGIGVTSTALWLVLVVIQVRRPRSRWRSQEPPGAHAGAGDGAAP